ncbi:MAG: DHA2 family efflux MFS transporter permease subunit [Alphaproteobacteria bacterium]
MSISAAPAAEERTNAQRAIILITMSVCTMLYALTLTIVNVALPQLQGALSATPDQVAWVVTLNVVATAIVTPMTGWFVARLGDRRVLIIAIVGFAVSSLLCATATTLAPLLLYRIGQGAFGAPLVPLAQAIIVATYPPHQRAMAQGIFGMSVVIGPAIAPVLGGYLAEEYNWRWVFLLILPLCLAALVGVLAFIHDSSARRKTRLDWTGFLALSLAVTCLQLLMDRGERKDWFESGEIILLAAAMLIGLHIFVVQTLTAKDPFISPAIFRDRNFTVGLLLVFVYGLLNVTPTVLFPSMLQNLKGYPDSLIGMLLAMRGAGMVIGFFMAAQMGRLDPRVGLVLGLGLVGWSGVMMANFNLDVTPLTVGIAGVIQGIGTGVMWVPLSVVTFASLPPEKLAEGSSLFHLLRNFGSSIFISLSVMAVVRTTKVNYSELVENVSPVNEVLNFASVTGFWNLESVTGLAALSREVGRQASMIGYTNAFVLYAAVTFATVPFIFFVKIKRR